MMEMLELSGKDFKADYFEKNRKSRKEIKNLSKEIEDIHTHTHASLTFQRKKLSPTEAVTGLN